MPELKITAEVYEELPEDQKEFYTENPEGGFMVVQDPGLKSAFEKSKQQQQALEKRLNAFNDYPTPEELEELRELKKKADENKVATEQDLEKLRNKYTETVNKYEEKIKGMQAQFDQQEIKVVANRVLTDTGASKAGLELMLRPMMERMKFVDGEVAVVDSDGSQSLLNPDKLAAEFKERYPDMFLSQRAGGTGNAKSAPAKPTGKNTMTRAEFRELSDAEKKEFFDDEKNVLVD